jgi:tripartite-type tricarboxylate transporter receptor subunit TctC
LRIAVAAIACTSFFAHTANSYPVKPVRVIVPSGPGGGYDFIGRLLAEKFGTRFGQSFVVDNRSGAGTLVGTQLAAAAPGDGYTLLIGGLSNIALNPGLYPKITYDSLRDFTPVAMLFATTNTLASRRDLPATTIQELITHARANPGKLTTATTGGGTGQSLATALFQHATRLDILRVTYKTAQAGYPDLISGRIDLNFDNTATLRPYLQAGRLKAFAISSALRSNFLPDVPTMRESGIALELEPWFALFATGRPPHDIIEKLRITTNEIMREADVRKHIEEHTGRVIAMNAAETDIYIKREVAKWPPLLKQIGMKAE